MNLEEGNRFNVLENYDNYKYNNNRAYLRGIIQQREYRDSFKYTYLKLSVFRLSNAVDNIIVYCNDNAENYNYELLKVGCMIEIYGYYKKIKDNIIFIAEKINYNVEDDRSITDNWLNIIGVMVEPAVYRKIKKDTQIISIIKINTKKATILSECMPCIAWRENAIKVLDFSVGDTINVFGRMQSRNFFNKKRNEETEINEISIFQVEKI